MQPVQKPQQPPYHIIAVRSAFLITVMVGVLALAGRYTNLHSGHRMPGRIPTVARLGTPSPAATTNGARKDIPPAHTSNPDSSSLSHKKETPVGPKNNPSVTLTPATISSSSQETRSSDSSPATSTNPAEKISPATTSATGSAVHQTARHNEAQATKPAAAKKHDWTKYEITSAIPNANIVIYLRQRVLLLRSYADYVRIYRNIAVPADISGPKTKAADKRAPIGNYYIGLREKTDNGFMLGISYPSATDADKAAQAGDIDNDTATRIRKACKLRAMPPQDTALGGNIHITGKRETMDKTDGGFALYPGQMEELWTAVKVGTPVIIVR